MPTHPQHRQRNKDALDLRLDQWIETGRQLVDGVAGNRPGQRKFKTAQRTDSSLKTVGRWVEQKIDWLLEEEDDYEEPWDMPQEQNSSKSKQPLKARSKRVLPTPNNAAKENRIYQDNNEWPDEDNFKLSRWKRSNLINSDSNLNENQAQSNLSKNRRLPRSTRKRSE